MREEDSKIKLKFLGIGWKTKISQKRSTFSISINKLVAEGNSLKKGQEIFSYLVEDEKGRKIILTYLDGKKTKNLLSIFAGAKTHVSNI